MSFRFLKCKCIRDFHRNPLKGVIPDRSGAGTGGARNVHEGLVSTGFEAHEIPITWAQSTTLVNNWKDICRLHYQSAPHQEVRGDVSVRWEPSTMSLWTYDPNRRRMSACRKTFSARLSIFRNVMSISFSRSNKIAKYRTICRAPVICQRSRFSYGVILRSRLPGLHLF